MVRPASVHRPRAGAAASCLGGTTPSGDVVCRFVGVAGQTDNRCALTNSGRCTTSAHKASAIGDLGHCRFLDKGDGLVGPGKRARCVLDPSRQSADAPECKRAAMPGNKAAVCVLSDAKRRELSAEARRDRFPYPGVRIRDPDNEGDQANALYCVRGKPAREGARPHCTWTRKTDASGRVVRGEPEHCKVDSVTDRCVPTKGGCELVNKWARFAGKQVDLRACVYHNDKQGGDDQECVDVGTAGGHRCLVKDAKHPRTRTPQMLARLLRDHPFRNYAETEKFLDDRKGKECVLRLVKRGAKPKLRCVRAVPTPADENNRTLNSKACKATTSRHCRTVRKDASVAGLWRGGAIVTSRGVPAIGRHRIPKAQLDDIRAHWHHLPAKERAIFTKKPVLPLRRAATRASSSPSGGYASISSRAAARTVLAGGKRFRAPSRQSQPAAPLPLSGRYLPWDHVIDTVVYTMGGAVGGPIDEAVSEAAIALATKGNVSAIFNGDTQGVVGIVDALARDDPKMTDRLLKFAQRYDAAMNRALDIGVPFGTEDFMNTTYQLVPLVAGRMTSANINSWYGGRDVKNELRKIFRDRNAHYNAALELLLLITVAARDVLLVASAFMAIVDTPPQDAQGNAVLQLVAGTASGLGVPLQAAEEAAKGNLQAAVTAGFPHLEDALAHAKKNDKRHELVGKLAKQAAAAVTLVQRYAALEALRLVGAGKSVDERFIFDNLTATGA